MVREWTIYGHACLLCDFMFNCFNTPQVRCCCGKRIHVEMIMTRLVVNDNHKKTSIIPELRAFVKIQTVYETSQRFWNLTRMINLFEMDISWLWPIFSGPWCAQRFRGRSVKFSSFDTQDARKFYSRLNVLICVLYSLPRGKVSYKIL